MNLIQSRLTGARRPLVSLVALALASLAASAQAQDADKMFSLSGFGTLGAVHSSLNKGDFVNDPYEAKGAGFSDATSVGVDSKLAVQVDAKLLDGLSAVVQMVMRQHTDGTYRPKVEWANLKYAITRDLSVRAGRIALPVFMMSETRLVGFANPWVRTPVETYAVFPVSNSDGADVSYRHNFGAISSTTQVSYGKTKVDVTNNNGSVSHDLHGTIKSISDTIEIGALTARLGWTQSDITLKPVPSLTIEFQSKIVNAGAVYDAGTWFVQGEVTRTSLGTVKRATRNAYVTGGYRIGQFTPYVGYSMITPDDEQVKLATVKQHTSTLGLRWDFRKNMDLKLQAEHIGLGTGSTGLFNNVKTGLAGTSGTVLSAAVDFVF